MEMAARLPAFLPRLAAIVLLGLALTATLTYAAGRNLNATPVPAAAVAPKAVPLVVPDVRNQAFVFAKGALEDGGFAWRVDGPVHGYSSNTVVSQSPSPGSKILDTGSPLVILTLKRTSGYAETGLAEDASSYAGTAVRSAELASTLGPAAPATSTAAATTTQATTTEATTTTAPAPKPTTPAKTATKTDSSATRWPQHRPPAFTVAGGHKEPLNEMPLPIRAQALRTWLEAHPHNTRANVAHWLYQNEWIVAGAKLGWWRGAEALAALAVVDRRTQQLWGIGTKSAVVAQRALREVQSRSK
jgi:PASTA domain-containing protein